MSSKFTGPIHFSRINYLLKLTVFIYVKWVLFQFYYLYIDEVYKLDSYRLVPIHMLYSVCYTCLYDKSVRSSVYANYRDETSTRCFISCQFWEKTMSSVLVLPDLPGILYSMYVSLWVHWVCDFFQSEALLASLVPSRFTIIVYLYSVFSDHCFI